MFIVLCLYLILIFATNLIDMDMNYYVLTFSIPLAEDTVVYGINNKETYEVQSRGYFDNLESAINKFEESHPGKVCTLISCISEMCNWKTLDKLRQLERERMEVDKPMD